MESCLSNVSVLFPLTHERSVPTFWVYHLDTVCWRTWVKESCILICPWEVLKISEEQEIHFHIPFQKQNQTKQVTVLETEQFTFWTFQCKQTHEKSIITKGLLTAARLPHPPCASKLSGKSEAGIMIYTILWGAFLPFSPTPRHFSPPCSTHRIKTQALQYLKYDQTELF